MELGDLLSHPAFLGASLMQVRCAVCGGGGGGWGRWSWWRMCNSFLAQQQQFPCAAAAASLRSSRSFLAQQQQLSLQSQHVEHTLVAAAAAAANVPLHSWCNARILPCPIYPHPLLLICVLQVIGPRHAFVISRGLEAKLLSAGGACSSSAVRSKGGAFGWNLTGERRERAHDSVCVTCVLYHVCVGVHRGVVCRTSLLYPIPMLSST